MVKIISKIFNAKPIINKANKQVNINVPKSQMPKELRDILKKDPSKIKSFRIKLSGWDW